MLRKVHHPVQLHVVHAPLKHAMLTDELLAPDMVTDAPQIDESVEQTEGGQKTKHQQQGAICTIRQPSHQEHCHAQQQQWQLVDEILPDAGSQGDDAIVFFSHTLL